MTEVPSTPTRFLSESGEWTVTPSIQNHIDNELNPFEFNFQERLISSKASIKDNTSKSWPVDFLPEAYDATKISDISPLSFSPSTPSLSVSLSPTSSTGLSSPKTLNESNVQSYSSPALVEEHQPLSPPPSARRNIRTQPKRHYFIDDDFEEEEYKPKGTQGGRKRRIVFEGDDAEERRKKFLERNRIAAYKCRQKKKSWMQGLEQRAEMANKQNEELRDVVAQLKEESIYLRDLLLTHSNCDCESVQIYLRKTSAQLTAEISNNSPIINNSPNTSFSMPLMFQTSLDSTCAITYPPFAEESTGLTPYLTTSLNQSTDYFS